MPTQCQRENHGIMGQAHGRTRFGLAGQEAQAFALLGGLNPGTIPRMPGLKNGYGEYVVTRKVVAERVIALHDFNAQDYERIYLEALEPNSALRQVDTFRDAVIGVDDVGFAADTLQELVENTHDNTLSAVRGLALVGGGSIELVFIPRTLYELTYINVIMQQELQIQQYQNWPVKPMAQYEDAHVDPDINRADENVELSRQLNGVFLERIRARFLPERVLGGERMQVRTTLDFPLTVAQLELLLEDEIETYKALVSDATARQSGYRYMLPNGHYSGTLEKLGTRLRTLGTLYTERDALSDSLRQTMAIEMESAGYFLLYRGTQHAQDSMALVNGSGGFPVSYNTGPFATLIYDRNMVTSTPSFMLAAPTDGGTYKEGHCLMVPYGDLLRRTCPFHVPLGNTLKQLHGIDQQVHAWSKTVQSYYDTHIFNQFILNMIALAAGSHLRHMLYYSPDLTVLNTQYLLYQVPFGNVPPGRKRLFYTMNY